MSSFWLSFAIQEAVTMAQVFVQMSGIKPGLKAALENMIAAGQAVATAIQSGQ
jgi:hypothetical protein